MQQHPQRAIPTKKLKTASGGEGGEATVTRNTSKAGYYFKKRVECIAAAGNNNAPVAGYRCITAMSSENREMYGLLYFHQDTAFILRIYK